MSSNKLCKACLLLEGLNRGLPKLGIGNSKKILQRHIDENGDEGVGNTIARFKKLDF
jgi:cytoplasmic tRNA 2-thiolation protein 1